MAPDKSIFHLWPFNKRKMEKSFERVKTGISTDICPKRFLSMMRKVLLGFCFCFFMIVIKDFNRFFPFFKCYF